MIQQEPQFVLNRSTNLLELRGLIDRATGVYPVDAVVTCSLLDVANTPLAGATDVPMLYASGTGKSSIYRGFIGSAVDCSASVRARVTITRNGAKREINVSCLSRDG
jgi:hypothetical protein